MASGVSLWVTYVIFRMVSTPICFWYLTLDIRDFPEIAWISEVSECRVGTGSLHFTVNDFVKMANDTIMLTLTLPLSHLLLFSPSYPFTLSFSHPLILSLSLGVPRTLR